MAEADIDDLIEIIEKEGNVEEIPKVIPMMPVRDVVVFTDMLLPCLLGGKSPLRPLKSVLNLTGMFFYRSRKTQTWKNRVRPMSMISGPLPGFRR